jgi:prepilin-type N-terminal cleavage/methylation domain-containing protein
MLTIRNQPQRAARGFSLIELMVSVTIGLIVAAGAVTLIVAIDRSNTESIQATRLTQELRALAGVIADDIKRTRRINDPIAMIGQGTAKTCPTSPVTPNQPCYPRQTNGTGGCIMYGYSGTTGDETLYNYRYVYLDGTNIKIDQYVYDPSNVATGTALPASTALTAACPITAALANTTKTTATLNSDQVNITTFCVSSSTDGGTCYFDSGDGTCKLNSTVPVGNEIDICIAGKLKNGDVYTKDITRAFVQPIFMRSSAI